VRFRPTGVGDDAETRLAFHFNFVAHSFVGDAEVLGQGFDTYVAGVTSTTTFFYSNSPRMRFTEIHPDEITTSTMDVVISGRIRGFDNIPGCRVKFHAPLTKRQQPAVTEAN